MWKVKSFMLCHSQTKYSLAGPYGGTALKKQLFFLCTGMPGFAISITCAGHMCGRKSTVRKGKYSATSECVQKVCKAATAKLQMSAWLLRVRGCWMDMRVNRHGERNAPQASVAIRKENRAVRMISQHRPFGLNPVRIKSGQSILQGLPA